MTTTISITVREGEIIWIPPKGTRPGKWRLLPKTGKGTRPIPHRLRRYLPRDDDGGS